MTVMRDMVPDLALVMSAPRRKQARMAAYVEIRGSRDGCYEGAEPTRFATLKPFFLGALSFDMGHAPAHGLALKRSPLAKPRRSPARGGRQGAYLSGTAVDPASPPASYCERSTGCMDLLALSPLSCAHAPPVSGELSGVAGHRNRPSNPRQGGLITRGRSVAPFDPHSPPNKWRLGARGGLKKKAP